MSVYQIPERFQEELEKEWPNGKIRVRWSYQWDEWVIEQKVPKHLNTLERPVDRFNDDLIRYRDGYFWIMSVKQGSRFSCPKCHLNLTAPTRETKMISCEYCRIKGYNHMHLACHWPLDFTLIDHLKKLERSIDTNVEALRNADAAMLKMQQREVMTPTVDRMQDDYNRLVGIPQFGYGGQQYHWQK